MSQMLHEMCHNALSAADIKAIGKSRGFSAKEIATPTLLANFFLSPIGVEVALQSLSGEEITFLYFLKELGREIDITPFSRVYGDASEGKEWRYGTFTQRYGDTFRQVKKSLVRKGLVMMAEEGNGGDTKMERWRFRFPPEFETYLPPLIAEATTMDAPGVYRQDVPRTKLLQLLEKRGVALPSDPARYAWAFKEGVLLLDLSPFSAQRLEIWQDACWEATTRTKEKRTQSYYGSAAVDRYEVYMPTQATVYALSQLEPREWVSSQQLAPVFKVFSRGKLDSEKVCEEGWRWGRLARQEVEGKMHYHLAPTVSSIETELDPASFLESPNGQFLEIDLETVPYLALAQINQIARLEVTDKRLVAKPSFLAAGRAPESVRSSPLVQWLRNNVAGFGQIFEKLDKRWGKQIIHDNLMLARVKDLSLRVKIEKSLGPKGVVSLSDDFIAFPYSKCI